MKRILCMFLVVFAVVMFAAMASAQTVTPHKVVLSATAPSDGTVASVYTFYRGNGACSISPVMASVGSVTGLTSTAIVYTDATVASATTYCYIVTQTANGFESKPSNTSQALTLPDPNAPSGLTVTTAK